MTSAANPNLNLWPRLWRHWIHPRLRVKHHFPTMALRQLADQVSLSEQKHNGQIRFVIESNLSTADVSHNITARQRAQYWFAHLGVWDTTQRNGILVYVLFADRAVEIIADRGINAYVPIEKWQQICTNITMSFQHEQYIQGLSQGLNELTVLLANYFPHRPSALNELPDEVILR
jgi:uncharacterized membrane protein